MKLSKSIEWLRPFIEASGRYIDLNKVTEIKSFRTPKNKTAQTDGCTHTKNKTKFLITIRTHSWDKEKNKHEALSKGSVLDTLAHELAHTKCWDHDWKHYSLHIKIMKSFVKEVKKQKLSLWPD